MSAYIEKRAFDNLTFRFESRNLTENQWCRRRTRFDGHIRDGQVREIEDYCKERHPVGAEGKSYFLNSKHLRRTMKNKNLLSKFIIAYLIPLPLLGIEINQEAFEPEDVSR